MYLSSLALLVLLIPVARAVTISPQDLPPSAAGVVTNDIPVAVDAVVEVLIDREASPDGTVEQNHGSGLPPLPDVQQTVGGIVSTAQGAVAGLTDGLRVPMPASDIM